MQVLELNAVQAAQIILNKSVELTDEEKEIARMSSEYWKAAAMDHFTDMDDDSNEPL